MRRLKTYAVDELYKKYKYVFSVTFVTGNRLFWEFKPIAKVRDDEGQMWKAYMIDKDLICLWGLGLSKKIPWGNLEMQGKMLDEYDTYISSGDPWPNKKERMQKVLSLLKVYYKNILKLEKNKRFGKTYEIKIEKRS